MDLTVAFAVAAALGGLALVTGLRILFEYERGVIFRLGKLTRAKGPGMIWMLPFGVERMRKMDLRILALDIAPQDTITKDNVSVTVNAVVYFRVADPAKAVVEIEDFHYATSQLAQTTLRSVIGQSELDELLANREQINEIVREIIDEGTDPWGVEVTGVEIKDIDLPREMKRAMAKQAEAERERRAKVIAAEGEFQASRRLAEAAAVIERHPVALQLRFLQTAVEIAAENNSTTVFPVPLDFLRGFARGSGGSAAAGDPRAGDAPAGEEAGGEVGGEAGGAVGGESGAESGSAPGLPEGASRELLAETARALLGIGRGEAAAAEPDAQPPGSSDSTESSGSANR